jgi:hypothetical protein
MLMEIGTGNHPKRPFSKAPFLYEKFTAAKHAKTFSGKILDMCFFPKAIWWHRQKYNLNWKHQDDRQEGGLHRAVSYHLSFVNCSSLVLSS